MVMALWKQPQQQPFTTYRDPQTGRWITIKSSEPIQDTFVEAPVYRNPETGQWITVKPTVLSENTLASDSL